MRLMVIVLAGLAALPASAKLCDVRQYGASGRRADLATKSIQAAIDDCTAAGGGTVLVPPGEYTAGSIRLKDNIELRVEAGAILFASRDDKDFPRDSRALLYANGATNIAVTGRGTIDGQAMYEWSLPRRADEEIVEERALAERAGLDLRRYNHAGVRIFLILIIDSKQVNFDGVRLLNSQFWTMRLVGCDGVSVRGVYIYNDPERAVNGDGIDLVSTRNVIISDSTILTGDDSICLKTEPVNGGPPRPTENVAVSNCILQSSSTALMIGTETHADIRHVVFSNCVIRDSNKAFGINVQDGAVVEDVRFSNITFELNRRHWNWWGSAEAFYFVLKQRTPESRLGAIRNITIDGAGGSARGTSRIAGHPQRAVEDITMRGLQIRQLAENTADKRATDAMQFDRVMGLRLENVSVRWDDSRPEPKWGSAVLLRRVQDAGIDGLTVRQGLAGGTAPAVLFDGVEGGWVRGVRALLGTRVLFGTSGELKDVRFTGNDARNAAKEFEGFPPVLKGF